MILLILCSNLDVDGWGVVCIVVVGDEGWGMRRKYEYTVHDGGRVGSGCDSSDTGANNRLPKTREPGDWKGCRNGEEVEGIAIRVGNE